MPHFIKPENWLPICPHLNLFGLFCLGITATVYLPSPHLTKFNGVSASRLARMELIE